MDIITEENKNKPRRVAVGLSGGVDSSVAAYLLKEQGYDVTGVYIQCWDIKADGCAADEDKAYAIQTAGKLGIKFVHLEFINDYKAKVIDHFYSEYEAGRTPNPDVLCNKEIKFGLFYDWAMKNGFDYVATGHYARISRDLELMRGLDYSKDQSYFLYLLTSDQLSKVLFPLGELKKKEVRAMASDLELPTATRPDSMGICFIGEVDTREFLKKRISENKGDVLYVDGEVIGDHDGVWFYTIGQRHGFRVNKYTGNPLYVIAKNVDTNELVVGSREHTTRDSFEMGELHWISQNPFDDSNELACGVRVRNLGEIEQALVKISGKGLAVSLKKPIFAIAPGQSAVLYDGDRVLGGGIIQ